MDKIVSAPAKLVCAAVWNVFSAHKQRESDMSNGMIGFEEFISGASKGEKPRKRRTRRTLSPTVQEVQVRVLMRLRELSREEALALVRRKRG